MTRTEFKSFGRQLARASAVGLGASLPFSTALDNILLGLVLIGWLAAGDFRAQWERLRHHPVAQIVAVFVGLLFVGLLYGERAPGDGIHYFGKYADLLFVPIFFSLFDEALWRRRALLAFAGSLALLLALSYLIRFGIIPPNHWIAGTPANPIVFRRWITHGILMAFGACLFVLFAMHAKPRGLRALGLGLAFLALVNVLFMIQSRTGYCVLVVLMLYLGYVWRGRVGVTIAALGTLAILAAVFAFPGELRQRTELAAQEFEHAQPGVATSTSIGQRLQFYRNSLGIIHFHPLLGAGTGGFPYAYQKQVAGTTMAPTRNPHNEYLHMLVQLGLAGLVTLLALFWIPWRVAPRLPTPLEEQLARALLLTLAVGCLFNSLLIDHTERIFFAWGLGILFAGLRFSNTTFSFLRI